MSCNSPWKKDLQKLLVNQNLSFHNCPFWIVKLHPFLAKFPQPHFPSPCRAMGQFTSFGARFNIISIMPTFGASAHIKQNLSTAGVPGIRRLKLIPAAVGFNFWGSRSSKNELFVSVENFVAFLLPFKKKGGAAPFHCAESAPRGLQTITIAKTSTITHANAGSQ